MRFDDEITRAVRHQAANDVLNIKTKEELEKIVEYVQTAARNNLYYFSKSDSIVLNKNGKKRFVNNSRGYYSMSMY